MARRVWQLRRGLARIDRIFTRLEHRANMLLYRTRTFVERGNSASSQLKQSYNSLQEKIQKLEKLLAIVRLTQFILWRQRYRTKKQ
ncbi:hypothetical protein ACL6C3_20960 [Capilliphycus salinus ALCB114379]|uniref:hypothetical protein n=1 Tax=Capilliphycus salinus TaxID=2768948 RepID=UPI0039A6308F